jgi:hypothetical protein
MAGALYYPSWSINDPVSLGEFLLFWDRLTFITPSKNWEFPICNNDRDIARSINEAHEKYALKHKPTEIEKAKCDKIIRNLFTSDPELFKKYALVIGQPKYPIDPRKLAGKTLDFLEEYKVLTRFYDDTYVAGEAGGHLVMAVLALCCSSQRLPPITTDDTQFTLQMLTVDDSLVPEIADKNEPNKTPTSALSMLLKRVKLPKAAKKNPGLLRQVLVARDQDVVNGYRETFQTTVREYCERLMKSDSFAETQDILADFDSAATADLKRLQKELQAAGVDAITSKDGVVAIVTGVAMGTVSLGVGGLGGTVLGWRAYRKARQSVIEKHWTSWLHQIEHPHFSIW